MTWKDPVVAYFKVLALISLAVVQKTTMTARPLGVPAGIRTRHFQNTVGNITVFDNSLSGANDALNKRCRKNKKKHSLCVQYTCNRGDKIKE